jgi:CPA1 family monovalent cation:H+ antiporter
MRLVELLVSLLLCSVAFAWVARRVRLPYPIALVLGGAVLGLFPELPWVTMDPDVVLAVFLPPVLYQAALFTSWRDFKRWRMSITMLAVGLVIATTIAVAVVAHWLIPGMPWAAAFALGAIVSPPDAVAATAILGTLRLPQRLVSVLEGESLVNDASGLVLYKFAVLAAVTGTFSAWHAGVSFAWVSAGGVALGVLFGWLFIWIQRQIGDPFVEVLLSLTLPYTAYLVAEKAGVSGVLAVVAAGLIRSRAMAGLSSPETRMLTLNVWNVIVFLFNSLIFVAIGIALPRIIERLLAIHNEKLYWYASAIVATAIVVRLVWVFPGAALARRMLNVVRHREATSSWRETLVIGWAGMRGIVTIAAALALPHVTASGEPFPHRLMIIFLAFSVVFATLIVQGLSLGPLIAALKIKPDDAPERELRTARLQMAHAALAVINDLAAAGALPEEVVAHVRTLYAMRLEHLDGASGDTVQHLPDTIKLHLAALHAERKQMIKLWRDGSLGDETRRDLERELDLEEARLAREREQDL